MIGRVKGRVGAAVGIFLCGCATTVGDISSIERLASNVEAPSRPLEPSRPEGFPDVLVVWARTAGGMETLPAGIDTAYARVGEDNPLPTPDNLPPAPTVDGGGQQADEFNTAANRAVSRVEIDDYDDTAILLSLQERLRSEPKLEPLKDTWEEKIDAAITRAEALRRVRVVLVNLKQAFAEAKVNPDTSLYDGIDMVSCRRAFAMLYERFTDDALLEVNIPPVGKKPLPAFNEVCEFSHQAELSTVIFPENVGKKRLRRLARKAVKEAYPNVELKQLSVTDKKWVKSDDGSQRELKVTIGIFRENVFPEDPCVMRELTITQTKVRKRFKDTECCEVRSERPVLCELLE